jgi:hypothetical protein
MKFQMILTTCFVALGLAAWLSPARADSSEAMCEVRKEGDKNKGASGPCTFSQRQGYIDLDLRNGNKVSLAPGSKANHYKDQNGSSVARSMNGSVQVYKWENGRKITVTFTATPSNSNSANASYRAGDTAPDLADLVGAKGGQAEGQLESRGYVYKSGSTSGDSKYSNWYNRSTGRCVTIRTEQGRYQSIVQAPPFDCGH